MMIKKFILFLFCLLLACSFFVSAGLTVDEIENINTKYESGEYNFLYRYYLAYRQSDISGDNAEESSLKNFFSTTKYVFKDFFGFGDYQKFKTAEYGFVLGFITALIMWIYSKLRGWYYVLFDFVYNTRHRAYDPDKDLSERRLSDWTILLAGSFWKVIVFAVMFGVLMYVPFLNRIIQFASLQMFDLGVWFHSLVLAIEIVILPQAIEDYRRATIETKMLKKRVQMEMGIRKNQVSGQIKD